MKQKLLTIKTLLVAALLGVGAMSAWADPIETIGSTSSGWWADFSETYTLEGYGSYHFQFTTTNANDGNSYKTWLLVATNGADSHGSGGTEYFVLRGDNYAWGQGKNSNPYNADTNADGASDKLVCSTTYSGENMQAAMNGATVDMVITRKSTNIKVTATVTPTNGDSEFTLSFDYLYGNAVSANVGLFLTVQNAQVVLNTAEQTKAYTKVYSESFDEESKTGSWTYSLTERYKVNPINSTKYLHSGNTGNGISNQTLSFSGLTAFTGADDYVFSFYYNRSKANMASRTNSTLTVKDTDGNALLAISATSDDANNNTDIVKDGSGNTLVSSLSIQDATNYYNSTFSSMYIITIYGNETDNKLWVTISNGSSQILASTVLSSSFKNIGSMVLGVPGKNGAMGVDDITLWSYSDEEIMTDPTMEVAYAGANRTVTITPGTSSKGNSVTTYYTTDGNDPTSSSNVYSSEVNITENCTVKAISISSAGGESAIISQAVTVGKLTLNAPTVSKTAYSDGKYTVNMSSSQTTLAYVPASVTIKYSIDDGEELTYSSAIAVTAGSTVTAHVEATDYTNSDETECATAARPTYYPTDWTETYTSVTSAAGTGVQDINYNDDADFTVNATEFRNIISYGSSATVVDLNTNVGLNGAFKLRCNGGNSGILLQSGTGYVGIQNLKAGEYIVLTTNGNSLSADYGVTLQTAMSTTSEYYFLATGTEASIKVPGGTYNYVKTITVLSPTVSVTITPAAGMATYVPAYDLDFTDTAIKAYTAKVNSTATCTLTEIKKVPAGTPVLLIGTTDDIPVAASTDAVGDNDLVAGTGAAVETTDGAGNTNMILNNGTSGVGFYFANNQTVAANRAYLHFASSYAPSADAPMMLVFADDVVTGINTVNGSAVKANGSEGVYNLSGQRVAKPTRGLYIVGGKKVVVK